MTQSIREVHSGIRQTVPTQLIVGVLVDKIVADSKGALQTYDRLLVPANAYGVIPGENLTLVGESHDKAHGLLASPGVSGAGVQQPH